MLIAGEPVRKQMLNPLLKTLGVQLANGMLIQQSEDYAPALVLPKLTKAAISFAKLLDKPSVDTLPISANGAAALSYRDTSGFQMQPLLITKAGFVSNTMRRNPDLDIVNTKEEANSSQGGGVQMIGGGGFAMAMPMPADGSKPGAKKSKLSSTVKNLS